MTVNMDMIYKGEEGVQYYRTINILWLKVFANDK